MARIQLPIVAPLDADGNKIINVGTPTEDGDAATKVYVDENNYTDADARDAVAISHSGDTLTYTDASDTIQTYTPTTSSSAGTLLPIFYGTNAALAANRTIAVDTTDTDTLTFNQVSTQNGQTTSLTGGGTYLIQLEIGLDIISGGGGATRLDLLASITAGTQTINSASGAYLRSANNGAEVGGSLSMFAQITIPAGAAQALSVSYFVTNEVGGSTVVYNFPVGRSKLHITRTDEAIAVTGGGSSIPSVTSLSTTVATANELVSLTAVDGTNAIGYYFRTAGTTTWTMIGASLTDSEIKTAYENNSNTNAFTDADETRLDNSILVNQGIVYQTQPTLAGGQIQVPSGDLFKSNVSTGNYQDRLYQNITNFALDINDDGYTYTVGTGNNQATRGPFTLDEGITAGHLEIYVNAGRYDATDNPHGHAGAEHILTTVEEYTGIRPLDAVTATFLTATTFTYNTANSDFKNNPALHQLITVGGTSISANPIAVTSIDTNNIVTLASSPSGVVIGTPVALVFQRTVAITQLEIQSGVTEVTGGFNLLNDVLHAPNLPTTDPGVSGHWWNDGGTLVLSGFTASEGGIAEDAPDWSGLSAYTVNNVVNFRNNIYKRRTENIIGTTGVSIVAGFLELVSLKNNTQITGALGYADTFVFDPNIDAPALTNGVVYRFTIGSGSTQYVIDANPGSTDVTANVGSLYGNGLQARTTRLWQLRLLTPTGTIAPGYTIISIGDPSIEANVYTAAQQVAAQTALIALLATKPDGTTIDNLRDGDQISFGGSPNTAPSEDISWELISNATLASSRYDLIEGELISFHQIPNGTTTASLNESDANRLLYDGRVIGLTTIQFDALGDRTLTNGTQAITLPNGMAELFPVGTWATGRGASFSGIFTGQSVTKLDGDATEAIRIRITSLRQDNSEAIVALDDTTVVPGLGTITRPGDVIQIARLEDVAPVTSIDEFDTQIVPNNSDAITLGTNFEPSAQVTYLTSFAPRENVEYNGEFYFYIGPGSHADFLHDAALRPQEFTNADFVPGNNKLNWVTYNEFINDISEADRSYSERIAATRDVTLHAQVRREIEAAKQDVLLTLSDRDSEREDQLVSLRPIWRLANTRYDDGSRFRRNVLYNAIRPDSTYTLTAGNRENTRGYNVFGTTGTVTFNGIIAVGAATVSGTVITVPTPSGTALTQAQIATIEYGSVGFRNPINLLTRNGLVSYSASATALTLTFSSASLASFTHDEFLSASGRLVIINTTQTTVNRKAASLCWVEFVEGSTRFTGEGLVIDNDGVIGRQELISALDTTSPEDNNGVVLGIENSDTTVHYFNSAKPWDDDFFTATGDQAVHCTVSAGNTGVTGTTFNDTRVTSLGAAQRFAWSARTYEDNPEDYFDLDPSANEYIIDNYNFAARAGGLVITGALLEPAVKSYSGFIWIASNASNMSNEALHPQNRVVQTPFRNVNTIDLSQFQSSFNANNVLETVAGVTQIQTLKMYGLTDTTIAAINSGNRVDFRFTLNEPGTESPPIYQLSTVGTTPYRTATSEIDVTFVNTTSQGVVALPELSRFTWQLDARAAGTITRPTLATEAYTATNITAGTAVQGAFLGPHGILTNESRYFQDSTKQWAAVTSTAREFNNSLFSRGESINPDTVVRGSDGTYYKWAFRGVENRFGGSVVIRYDNVQVVRGSDGRFSSSSINPAPGDAGSIYDPASEDETVFDDEGTRTTDPIITLDNLNNLFQVNSVHPFTVEYDGYFNLAAGESATNASIIFGGTTTIGRGVTNFAELNRFVLMDPTALHAQATLVAGGSTNSQAIRDGHAFNNLWSVLEVDEVYPQYRSTEHNAIGAYQETTLQYSVDASRLQGTPIENASPRAGQVLRSVEIPDPDDSSSTIMQWQPGYAASTIPDHRTIPVTTSGANPFDLVGWQLTFGSGDDRIFEALAQAGSTGTIDTTIINEGEALTVTFADGSIEQGHVFGGTDSTTRLFGQLTRRPVSSLLTNNVATATIRYYGDTAAESYVASPLTVNSDSEVIYGGSELATMADLTSAGLGVTIAGGTFVDGEYISSVTETNNIITFVKRTWGNAGIDLDDLQGVTISGTPSDNEVLAYDSATGMWIPQASVGDNQNAFSNILVGATTISADTPTDTLQIVGGTGILVSADSTFDILTLSISSAANLIEAVDTIPVSVGTTTSFTLNDWTLGGSTASFFGRGVGTDATTLDLTTLSAGDTVTVTDSGGTSYTVTTSNVGAGLIIGTYTGGNPATPLSGLGTISYTRSGSTSYGASPLTVSGGTDVMYKGSELATVDDVTDLTGNVVFGGSITTGSGNSSLTITAAEELYVKVRSLATAAVLATADIPSAFSSAELVVSRTLTQGSTSTLYYSVFNTGLTTETLYISTDLTNAIHTKTLQ